MALTLSSCNRYSVPSGEYETLDIPFVDAKGDYTGQAFKRSYLEAELTVRGKSAVEVRLYGNGIRLLPAMQREGRLDGKGRLIFSDYDSKKKDFDYDTVYLMKKGGCLTLIDDNNVFASEMGQIQYLLNEDTTIHHVEYRFVKKGE